MKIIIHGMDKLNAAQQTKIRTTLGRLPWVLASQLWENRIKTYPFTQSRGYNGGDIVRIIRETNGGVLEVHIVGFFAESYVVGYTYLYGLKQWINTKYLDKMSEAKVAGHFMHETMHRVWKFTHKKFAGKKHTVPYAIGYETEAAYLEFYKKVDKDYQGLLNTDFTLVHKVNKLNFEVIYQ